MVCHVLDADGELGRDAPRRQHLADTLLRGSDPARKLGLAPGDFDGTRHVILRGEEALFDRHFLRLFLWF